MAAPKYSNVQFGVLGVGDIGKALTVGLLTGSLKPTKPILLSEEGGDTPVHTKRLCERFPEHTAVRSTNAAVAQEADVVFICTPWRVVGEILQTVPRRKGQIFVSAAAMVPVTDLAVWAKPASAVRTLPMVSAEFQDSHTLVCFDESWSSPTHPSVLNREEVLELLECYGTVTEAQSDEQLQSLGFGGLSQKAMLDLLHSMALTLQRQGIPEQMAAQTVAKLMRTCCGDAMRAADAGVPQWRQLAARGSRGEFNQQIADLLSVCGFFAAHRVAMGAAAFGKFLFDDSTPQQKAALGLGVASVAFSTLLLVF